MLGIGLPMTPELGEAITGHLDRMPRGDGPLAAAEGGYFNFAERPCDADAILPAEACARLAEVKRRYDPENRIVANHAVSLDPPPRAASPALSPAMLGAEQLEALDGGIVLADQPEIVEPPLRCPQEWPRRSPRYQPSPWCGRRKP